MGSVTDAFLLEMAGISASLLGFFVVGVFFYVQRGIFPQAGDRGREYLKAATRTVIYLYGMALLISLGLVVLDTTSLSGLYAALSVGLAWSVWQTSTASRRLHAAVAVRVLSYTAVWLATCLAVGIPWVFGGVAPSRSHFTWGLMLVSVIAFISAASLVLSTFDLSALEGSADGGLSARTKPTERRLTHLLGRKRICASDQSTTSNGTEKK